MEISRIDPRDFTQALKNVGLSPVVQVPCSYFKEFIDYLLATKEMEVISPVNEAVAMGIAAGSYLSTGRIPIVAIQNSGFMNTLNALTSLQQIYDIPVFYIITWRGEGGKGSDVPAHDVTGPYMEQILQAFLLPYEILDPATYHEQIQTLTRKADTTKKPVALILRKNTFQPYQAEQKPSLYPMNRFEAMQVVKEAFIEDAVFLSATGFPSRDAFNIKDTPDFYVVGSMGHIFAIALGIAPNTQKRVVVLDGDGSALMHLGGLASFDPNVHTNLVYVVFDNESYESTGGQATLSPTVDFAAIARAFHFPSYIRVEDRQTLQESLAAIQQNPQPAFLHIKVKTNIKASGQLPTDVYSSVEIKERFMKNVQKK
ncbi:MAG TPA: phosphonopyruvate decarboxylase [Ktedonobacteraceae bacterium]|nr:phosphonopyruvate decarboxylase [Ktedonobacteraceae bacterium]